MTGRTAIGRLRRLVACTLLASYSASCTYWRVQNLSPQQVVAAEQPSHLRVTRPDSTHVVLTQPEVAGDSLTGLAEESRLSIALSDVANVAVRRVDPLPTLFLVFLSVGTVVAAAAVISLAHAP